MATQLAATLGFALTAAYANGLPFGSVAQSLQYNFAQQFSDGTGAGQAQKLYTNTITLAPSATQDLDLAGVLTDAFGAVLTFSKIKGLFICAAAANVNDVVVGGAASNGFISWVGSATDKVKVKPGGALLLVAPDVNGYAVTPATADLLRVGNGGAGTSVTLDIGLIGL